jgi:hypothetical protein
MDFKHQINDTVYSLIENQIVEGKIISRKYTENSHGSSLTYDINLQFLDGERSTLTACEGEVFPSPDRLVANLLDIFIKNREDFA